MPHVLGLKQKDVCQRVRPVLVGFVAAISFAETKEGQDKRSCKQSADQLSNTCAPCPQHTYGERLWGRE